MSLFFASAFILHAILVTENHRAADALTPNKNVLLFFVDDGGFMQTAYNNTVCDTPNLDKLAARSVVFNRGYTSVSSCSPSRSVLLTGLPQHQNGMYGLYNGLNHYQSFEDVKSLPVILGERGVYTGIIGKYNVAPKSVYSFDYMKTRGVNQVGRNITNIKLLTREFFQNVKARDQPFFLYIAFYDTHRGGWDQSDKEKYGPFYNKWGDGEADHGVIPDWTPHVYDAKDVIVPYYLPDTQATREELAAMYTSFNRMDQGVGLIMKELEDAGFLEDTLVMFTADNGIPFPHAKTNLYEPGIGEPMMISSPEHPKNWGKKSDALANTMDFTPTILDWMGVKYPRYKLNRSEVTLTGKSLLPLAEYPDDPIYNYTFSSHNFHEVTMPYPMRVVTTDRYRLIHNINYGAAYPMATDMYSSDTFQDILNRTRSGQETHWFKSLDKYYFRDEWELFDLQADPRELNNLWKSQGHQDIFRQLNETLSSWLAETKDPWRCMPHAVLLGDSCHDMHNIPKSEL